MQLVQIDWLSGVSAPETSSVVQVEGAEEISVQVSGPVDAGCSIQGSIDGVLFETFGNAVVASGDSSDGTEITPIGLQGARFVRLHCYNDGGGTVTASAVIR